MKVVTSDNKTLDVLEGLQAVAKKTREIPAIKRIAEEEKGGKITYNGRSIGINDGTALAGQIPSVLNDMRLHSWNGEVYASGGNVFQGEFAKCLNFLLAWLNSIPVEGDATRMVGITAFEAQSVLEWIKVATKECELQYSERDVACVESMVNQL
jgi:hypothetical protein